MPIWKSSQSRNEIGNEIIADSDLHNFVGAFARVI